MIFFNWTKYLVKGAKGFRSFFFWFGWRHMDVGWGGPAVFESLSTHPVRPIRQSHTSLSSSSLSLPPPGELATCLPHPLTDGLLTRTALHQARRRRPLTHAAAWMLDRAACSELTDAAA